MSYLRLRAAFEFGLGRGGAGTIRLCDRALAVGVQSPKQDLDTFVEIFVEDAYGPLNVQGAEVLDLGAHKGYFAAWALRRGAARVISLEPHPENFAALRAACGEDGRWEGVEAAVGALERKASLHVSESWAHSLVGVTTAHDLEVDVLALADVVARLGTLSRRVAKIDIEGSEHELASESGSTLLAQFDEIAIEIHGQGLVKQHLTAAGLEETQEGNGIAFFRRGRLEPGPAPASQS